MPAEGSTLRSGRWAVMIRMSVAGFKFDAPVLRSAGFGRSAALVLKDGALVIGKPRWRVRSAFERRRLPSWVWAAAATKAGQRVLARLGLPQGR